MAKKNEKQKISPANILGAIGAISGLATGAFLLYAEMSSYNVFPYRVEYHSYDAWKYVGFMMFFVSLISWIIYVIYRTVSYYKNK
jgi:hypothetical protein